VQAEGQATGKEKAPGRQAKPGPGRGRGGRGRGRGSRGGGGGGSHHQGVSHSHIQGVPHSHSQSVVHNAVKEEPKQKSRISEYMLSDDVRDEKRSKPDIDDSPMFEKPLSPPSNLKYPSHNGPYINDNNVDRYSYARPNIFKNDHESDDDSSAMQNPHMLPHSHLPQLQFDALPHKHIPLPHEHSYTPNFPPLSQYRPYHFTDNKMMDNDTSTFIFDRQSPHKKLPVQLPPLFPPPPQLPPNFPHDRPFKQSVFNNSR